MPVRKSQVFFISLLTGLLLFCLMALHAVFMQEAERPHLAARKEMVKRFELSDLALFTDARYSRHPSMADFNSAFQDHPMSFEHFPSGSLLTPPEHLKGQEGK